ncbi:hypothetical protein C8Q80DRAFT_1108054 [Daedaleopsis nitida]|nr:hypothetical protein C8Q80DRAFT_1108054 [Daedaleopsis nitida]
MVLPYTRAERLTDYALHAACLTISTPANGVQWANKAVNPIEWEKGLLDGVSEVDIELARLSGIDGLIYFARDAPTSSCKGALNLFIQDVPTGDDYYLLFFNSTHGVMYSASQRFAIVGDTGNRTVPTPAATGIGTLHSSMEKKVCTSFRAHLQLIRIFFFPQATQHSLYVLTFLGQPAGPKHGVHHR